MSSYYDNHLAEEYKSIKIYILLLFCCKNALFLMCIFTETVRLLLLLLLLLLFTH